jgi:hypothetical protein
VAERWIAQAGVRRDLFGFIDVVAIKPGEIIGVQVTTSSNLAARLRKSQALPNLAAWLAAGGKFQAHGWAKRGGRWHCRVVEVQAVNVPPVEVQGLPRQLGTRR